MSKKYYLYRKQKGEGCDYTIACGESLSLLSAKSMEEAIDEVINFPDLSEINDEDELNDVMCDSMSDVSDNHGYDYAEIEILEVTSTKYLQPLIDAANKKVHALKESLSKKKVELAERQQYEKLKKKFS